MKCGIERGILGVFMLAVTIEAVVRGRWERKRALEKFNAYIENDSLMDTLIGQLDNEIEHFRKIGHLCRIREDRKEYYSMANNLLEFGFQILKTKLYIAEKYNDLKNPDHRHFRNQFALSLYELDRIVRKLKRARVMAASS